MYIGKYGNGQQLQQSYYSFINNPTAYATCTPCPPGDWWCGAMKWGCDVQNAVAVNPTVTTLSPAYPGSTLDTERKKIVNAPAAKPARTPSSSTSSNPAGTPASSKCGGCNAGDIGCELGKLSCEATSAAAGWWNGMGESIGKGTGGLGILPIVAIGGGILIVALLARR
jgi:hypothetical protein